MPVFDTSHLSPEVSKLLKEKLDKDLKIDKLKNKNEASGDNK